MTSQGNDSILDLLIVGGGPAGTAAAFRAAELGLQSLVIDFDDVMKRIRDYSKDKLILPSFGGGDRMCFPKGGELVAGLCFEPIDKDQMCADWKALYQSQGVAHQLGIELTGLERQPDQSFRVQAWDHTNNVETGFSARHVALALGRGVPRRFDIPGNTDGIAYRLSEAKRYLGRPACVVGGGTSAAEAVIAISNAKAEDGDPSSVYWCYRGDKMPRVSKALADSFFAAYVGNGNIRYHRKSEPAAIVVGDDRQEYLAVRVDRRSMENRPGELTLLEFPKECCIACIGEDIPEALLNSLGIEMVVGGDKKKKRMVVNRCLETRESNVYLIGDLLSQAYFETEDFDADPAGFSEVKHRGNIKSALRDGVLVAQVVAQKLAGKTEIETAVEEVEPEPSAGPVASTGSITSAKVAEIGRPIDSGGPPVASLDQERVESGSEAILVRVLPTGIEENEYPIPASGVTTIGSGNRDVCDISIPSDSLLSPRHGSVAHSEEGYFVRDDGSATGVFLRVAAAKKIELTSGDLVRAGRQFLVFSNVADAWSVTQYDVHGQEVGKHELTTDKAIVLGRDAPGIVLDADDGTLSRRHLALSVENGRLLVKDLKSVNGTFLRVRSARRLEHGDQIRLGSQTFNFSLRPEIALDAGLTTSTPVVEESPEIDASSETGLSVTIEGVAEPVSVASGQTICEALEAAGVKITAECHSGICGSDPIRILSGQENLVDEPGDQERETLEDLCELEPGPCRLACMVKLKGPVKIEIL